MASRPYADKRHEHLADVLAQHGIKYRYCTELFVEHDSGVAVQDNSDSLGHSENRNVIQPHFYLPEHYTVIEFPFSEDYCSIQGRSGEPEPPRVEVLREIYFSNHYHFIDIPPERQHPRHRAMPRGEYRDYVLASIEEFLARRLEDFRGKIEHDQ